MACLVEHQWEKGGEVTAKYVGGGEKETVDKSHRPERVERW